MCAVFAVRAARLPRLAGRLPRAVPLVAFVADLGLDEALLDDFAVVPAEALAPVCPVSGVTAINAESAPVSHRAGHGKILGEVATLMLQLYADFVPIG